MDIGSRRRDFSPLGRRRAHRPLLPGQCWPVGIVGDRRYLCTPSLLYFDRNLPRIDGFLVPLSWRCTILTIEETTRAALASRVWFHCWKDWSGRVLLSRSTFMQRRCNVLDRMDFISLDLDAIDWKYSSVVQYIMIQRQQQQ